MSPKLVLSQINEGGDSWIGRLRCGRQRPKLRIKIRPERWFPGKRPGHRHRMYDCANKPRQDRTGQSTKICRIF